MKLTNTSLALAFASIFAASPSAAATAIASTTTATPRHASTDETPWVSDYDAAVKIAKREGKDLLIDFTGSDWCSWCIKLHDEVFSKEAFLAYATENYVLVALDFPHKEAAKSRVPNPDRNQELAQMYEISGFPTVLLMTADGDLFGRTGYAPGGPEAYVKHLQELRTNGRAPLTAAIKLSDSYKTAEGPARQAILIEILDLLDGLPESSMLAKYLIQPARDAIALDPDNAKGLRFRAVKGLLNSGLNDSDLIEAASQLDPKNQGGLLELGVLARFREASELEQLPKCCDALDALIATGNFHAKPKILFMFINAAIWNQQFLEDLNRAKKYARLALNFEEPINDEEIVARLQDILDADAGTK